MKVFPSVRIRKLIFSRPGRFLLLQEAFYEKITVILSSFVETGGILLY